MKPVHLVQILSLTAAWTFSGLLSAQTFNVSPYLQDGTPTSMRVMWETTGGSAEESHVEWGLNESLGSTTTGIAAASQGENLIHDVELTGLAAFTTYFYRAVTGNATSETHRFRTAPEPGADESFRIIAMSDMQRDNAQPAKFQEIVQDGILDFIAEETSGALSDEVALVMIPGDLVVTGTNYEQWADHFFTPSAGLFSDVPVYPVLGNHEQNATFYFQYFHLPENGTAGYEEHWWHKDYGNVRMIGLNSNGAYAGSDQLAWLDVLLEMTESAEHIDFVFAQLHHPHKSELWTPGESNFTGDVVEQLEDFTETTGKPSIHFFGHTHGYSRGQSRDHKHLWINVATAGGAIDHWGDYPQYDYEEFSVSHEEWGFVSVEVVDGASPHLIIKRISRGKEGEPMDNVLRDSLVLRKAGALIDTPVALFPVAVTLAPECVVLQASAFAGEDSGMLHGQSHWQISSSANDFDNPIQEAWKNYENWYYNIDTQAGDDLTDEHVEPLDEGTVYWWRVRYRDREFNWSDWSEVAIFETSGSLLGENLLINPGGEDGTTGWTAVEGVVESLTDGECAGTAPHTGTNYLAVGGLCIESAYGLASQSVDVSDSAAAIDAGTTSLLYGGFLSDWAGSDLPEMRLIYEDELGNPLGASDMLSTLNSSWTELSAVALLPPSTRTVRCELSGTLNSGVDNDCYFDDLYMRWSGADCGELNLVTTLALPPHRSELLVAPNPWFDTATMARPAGMDSGALECMVFDSMGRGQSWPITMDNDRLRIERGDLPSGRYMFTLAQNGSTIGKGVFVLE